MVKSKLLIGLLILGFIWISTTAEATVTASIAPEIGTVGSEITVAGTCTADSVGTKTAVWIDFGDYSTVAIVTSSEEGTFTAAFSVPLEPYGTHTITVRTEECGSTTIAFFIADKTSPVVTITSPTELNSTYRTGTSSITVTFTYIEPNLSTATVSIVGVGTASPLLANGQGTATIAFTGLTQATYTILVQMVDLAGNVGTDTEQALVIDNTKPAVNITKPTLANPAYGTSAGSVVVTFSYTESRISTVTVSIVGKGTVSPTFSAGQGTASISYSGLTQGTYILKVEMIDLAGNVGSDTENALVIDTTAPVINDIDVTSDKPTYFYGPDSLTIGTGGTVYFNSLSGEGAGQILTIIADITEANVGTFSGASGFNDGTQTDTSPPYELQYSVEANAGSQTILFTIIDKAGNVATATIIFIQNNIDPIVDITNVTSPHYDPDGIGTNTEGNWYNQKKLTSGWSVTFTAINGKSGLRDGTLTFDYSDGTTYDQEFNCGTGGTYVVGTLTNNPDGTITVTVIIRDNAGNIGTDSIIIRFDNTPPSNPGTANAFPYQGTISTIPFNIWQRTDADPYFEWSGAEDGLGCGVDGYSVYWGTNSSIVPEATITQRIGSYTVKSPVLSQMPYYLIIRTRDNVGNWSGSKTIFIFKYDDTSPGSPTVTANKDNPSPWINKDNFLIEWRGTDTAKIKTSWYKLINPEGTTTKVGTTTFEQSNEIITGSFTIQVGTEGISTLFLWLEDEAGNIGETSSVKLRYDISPPTIEALWPARDEWVNEYPIISAWIRDVSYLSYQGEIGTITVLVDGKEIMSGLQGFDQNSKDKKNFKTEVTAPLSSDSHRLEVVVWDKAGNKSATATGTFRVGKEQVIDLTNYPNPFASGEGTHIRYVIGKSGDVTINIYSVALRLIDSIELGTKESGEYKLKWAGLSDTGEKLPNGMYICELVVDGKPQAYCKMAIINH